MSASLNVVAPGLNYDVAFSVGVHVQHVQSVGMVETERLNFQGIDWKLRIKFEENNADEIEICEDNDTSGRFECALLASASMTSDWSCTLQRHVLAVRPYGSLYDDFASRPSVQFKVVGKRALDSYAGFFNVSTAQDDEEVSNVLTVNASDVAHYVDPSSGVLTYEVYIRGVGPIFYYPTYFETYDFGSEKFIMLKVNQDEKLFKVPVKKLKKVSVWFKQTLTENNDSNSMELSIDMNISYMAFRSFLQCVLPPFLPISKAANYLKEIIGLAKLYSCTMLFQHCVDYLIETSEVSPVDKLSLANAFNIPIVAMYGLDEMPLKDVETFMASDEFKSLNPHYKGYVLRRLSDV